MPNPVRPTRYIFFRGWIISDNLDNLTYWKSVHGYLRSEYWFWAVKPS
jgi:hypothetical protein